MVRKKSHYRSLNLVPGPEETPKQTFFEYLLDSIRQHKGIVMMVIFANFIALASIHLLLIKYTNAFPHIPTNEQGWNANGDNSKNQHFPLSTDQSSLTDLINSAENKAIFSELEFSSYAFYDNETNVIGTIEFAPFNQYQRQPYVANGYIGSRIPNLGHGFTYDQLSDSPDANSDDLLNGWPLFNPRYAGAFIAGFYNIQKNTTGTNFPELLDNGYESVIAAVPQWTTLKLSTSKDNQNYTLDPALPPSQIGSISNYVQNLSLSNGIVTTQYTWLDSIDVKYEILAHRSDINLGVVNLEVYNSGNETVKLDIIDELDFKSAQRSQLTEIKTDANGIYVTFQPSEIDYVNGAIYSTLIVDGPITRESTNDTASQTGTIYLQPKEGLNATKFAGIVSSDLNPEQLTTPDSVLNIAKEVSGKNTKLEHVVKSHTRQWEKTMGEDPLITFPESPLLNLGARASIYHLIANTRPDAQGVTAATGVGGLSSDSYAGLVFWDTDLWMSNALLPFAPDHAKSIVNYRLYTHAQAIKNLPPGAQGAVYPWTSNRFGNCTGTGPCLDYEYHINVAASKAAWNFYISGAGDDDYLANVAYPIINDAAKFFSGYVQYNETYNKYTSHNLTDPDEYANHVDNGAYTNAGISLVMKWAIAMGNHLGKEVPQIFQNIAGNMYLPSANNSQEITLEYSGMNSSVAVKQADVIMINYPMENELLDKEQAYENMEFYSMKQVSYGPAMTFPIFSIVAADLAPSGCASQSYLQKAIQPFLRGPFAQFSEQNHDDFLTNGGTHPAFPFLTAHGGFTQAILQGLTGMRYDYISKDGKMVRALRVDPIAIPCLGSNVQYEGIHYNNHSVAMSINETHFTIQNRGPTDKSADNYINIIVGERNPKQGQYSLDDYDAMVIPLFTPVASYPDSISECALADFYNITEGAYGDLPISINDGDNTTRWQVKDNDTTGKVLVDLKSYKNISNILFNWRDKPPKSMTLSIYNGNQFTDPTDFFSKVDFGNGLYNNYKYRNPDSQIINQSKVFTEVHSASVDISAPFDNDEFTQVMVPERSNVTSLDLALYSRFLLIEVEGTHNTEPIAGDTGGAKLAEVTFF
ncbi:Cell wall acid trehalase ATC1 [Spathaspora sp. JA1]|nr:Cell wall acid trehalase ATC1 [Spathaspora sp. JA1]